MPTNDKMPTNDFLPKWAELGELFPEAVSTGEIFT
jgi:hypothetical protein